MPSDVTLETIREALQHHKERYGFEFPQETYEQQAAGMRDALVQMGLDPSDRTVLDTLMLSSFLCLGHIINSASIVIGMAMPLTYIQADIARMWIEGEMPTISLADALALKAMDLLNPGKCPFIGVWPDGRGSGACTLLEHHEQKHLVPTLEVGDGGEITTRMLEFDNE